MDDHETLHRRARLRELIATCFGGKDANLLEHIARRTGKRPNQGELSGLQKDNGGRSFGDKKAKTLTEQIGLSRRWFELPCGANLNPPQWQAEEMCVVAEEGRTLAPCRPPWPFTSITEGEVQALSPIQLAKLDGAMALAIAQLKIGGNVEPID